MGHVNMHHDRGQAGENRQRYFIYQLLLFKIHQTGRAGCRTDAVYSREVKVCQKEVRNLDDPKTPNNTAPCLCAFLLVCAGPGTGNTPRSFLLFVTWITLSYTMQTSMLTAQQPLSQYPLRVQPKNIQRKPLPQPNSCCFPGPDLWRALWPTSTLALDHSAMTNTISNNANHLVGGVGDTALGES